MAYNRLDFFLELGAKHSFKGEALLKWAEEKTIQELERSEWAADQAAEKERQKEKELKKIEAEIELKRIEADVRIKQYEAETAAAQVSSGTQSNNLAWYQKKVREFDEDRDDIDVCIKVFFLGQLYCTGCSSKRLATDIDRRNARESTHPVS